VSDLVERIKRGEFKPTDNLAEVLKLRADVEDGDHHGIAADLMRRAADKIERLQSLVGAVSVGRSLADLKRDLPSAPMQANDAT
jgi:hypothetical protein